MTETARIFVGCAANHEDAESQAVFEWSVRKHASLPVEITWMKLSRDPASPFYCSAEGGWRTEAWATPFSGFRWAVPELCGFEGRGIYMDSDVIVMADIAELWQQPFMPARVVLAKGAAASWRYCVSLWDCERARRWMLPLSELQARPDSHRAMTRVFRSKPHLTQPFHGGWNCLDGEDYDDLDHPDIKAIHYSAMRHQPHLTRATARLREEGRKHWFDGKPALHWRPDLILLFERLLAEAEWNDYPVQRYCQTPIFGAYRKLAVGRVGPPGWARKKFAEAERTA